MSVHPVLKEKLDICKLADGKNITFYRLFSQCFKGDEVIEHEALKSDIIRNLIYECPDKYYFVITGYITINNKSYDFILENDIFNNKLYRIYGDQVVCETLETVLKKQSCNAPAPQQL